MASIEFKLKTTLSWWVMPLLNCTVVWWWLTGRDDIPPGFIDWVVRHGLKIELY
ncbi:hypothetical protein [Pseudomonas sp. Xaverov 259]|uniref:hypothetical protein n=1 Tax=Pseudomonas sp. Xaverov 259 TaxID=2666086 RepID=UPI001C5AD27A|nr:hypothetical protein [Pseudomonas sp. Xaverov 259]